MVPSFPSHHAVDRHGNKDMPNTVLTSDKLDASPQLNQSDENHVAPRITTTINTTQTQQRMVIEAR
jgi:hypothetical protein